MNTLPRHLSFAVEVRHPEFFRSAQAEHELNGVLREASVDRVILDSRPLFSCTAGGSGRGHITNAQAKAAGLVHGDRYTPLVRVIGRNDIQQTLPWLREWAARLARWIETGLRPFVFTHTPDELYAPLLARAFHDELRRHTNVPERAALRGLGSWSEIRGNSWNCSEFRALPMAETIGGLIERVTYHNPENGFAVLRVRLEGQK